MYRTIKQLIKLLLDLEGGFNCLLFKIFDDCKIRDLPIGVRIRNLVRVRLFKPSAFALDCHISLQSLADSLLRNWSGTERSEGFGNITGLGFETHTRIGSPTSI